MDTTTRKKFIQISLKRAKPGTGSSLQFLTTRTWRNQVTDLRSIITEDYVIVGGVATRLYMPERMTDDLAILIHLSNSQKVYDSLIENQAKEIGSLSIGGTSWELSDGTVLDIIVSDRAWVKSALLYPKQSPDDQPVIDISRMLGQANDAEIDEVRRIIKVYDPNSLEDLESLIQLGKLEMQ
jgi:hypothetical protein